MMRLRTLLERRRALLRRHGATGGAQRGERGVALVEAAIVTPLLLLLVFGIIEFGFLFKDSLTLANASRAGARVGSAAGTDPLADWDILQAVKGASGSLTNVQQVVVFKATGANGSVPSNCTGSVGVSGLCNVYSAADFNVDATTFQSASYTKDNYWASSARVTSLSSTNGPDYLGVYVKAQHTSVLTIVVPSRTITDTVVMRLEPTR
jgi:Flp pilus assembly protein TadG